MTTLSLQDVAVQLHHMAQAARSDAMITGDYGVVKLMSDRAKLFARMAETCILAIQAGDTVTLPPAPRKAAAKRAKVSAEAWWLEYVHAVNRIRTACGDHWRTAAPMGETTLVRLPASLASYKNERGTTIRYSRDQRIPSARFWPGGVIPSIDLMTVAADYARETGKGGERSDAWHVERGYVARSEPGPDGVPWVAARPVWMHPMLANAEAARAEARAEYKRFNAEARKAAKAAQREERFQAVLAASRFQPDNAAALANAIGLASI